MSRCSESTTGTATRLYDARCRVTSDNGTSGVSGSMSVSTTPEMSVDGGSRSRRWKCAVPRYLPVGVSYGGRTT